MKFSVVIATLAVIAGVARAELSHSSHAAPRAAIRRHHVQIMQREAPEVAKAAASNATADASDADADVDTTATNGTVLYSVLGKRACSGHGTYYNVQTGNQG